MFPNLSLSKLRSFADTWTFSFPDMTWCKFSITGVCSGYSGLIEIPSCQAICWVSTRNTAFAVVFSEGFSFGQTNTSHFQPISVLAREARVFCIFVPSKSQPSKVSHLAKWYYSSFVAFSLHVVQSGPRIPIVQLGVHVCWALFLTKLCLFATILFLKQSSCPLPTHGGHPISTLTCQNLDEIPGGKLRTMQCRDTMAPDTAYVSMLFGTMQGNPMQLLFDVFETTVKLKLELGLRCVCEQTSEKAASCGTIQRSWHICGRWCKTLPDGLENVRMSQDDLYNLIQDVCCAQSTPMLLARQVDRLSFTEHSWSRPSTSKSSCRCPKGPVQFCSDFASSSFCTFFVKQIQAL